MSPFLIATHLTAFFFGGLVTYALTTRTLRARDVDGNTALEITPSGEKMSTLESLRRSKTTAVLLLAAVVVITIGIQAKLAADDNRERDTRQRAYTLCLSKFAGDLVENLDHRAVASARLERAERAKNAALDDLLTLTLTARTSGAKDESQLDPKLVARFNRVLLDRVEAQHRYNRIYRHVMKVRAHNPYVPPRAVCE